jgi:hypothetical protein
MAEKSKTSNSQKQTYVKDSTDIDVDRIILLFKVLVGIIVVLLVVVGCIVVKETRTLSVCISLVIGDGVCDDARTLLNVTMMEKTAV